MQILTVLLFIVVVIASIAIAIIAIGREKFWARIGGEDLGPFDFQNLTRSPRPNDALLATKDTLPDDVTINLALPSFEKTPEDLMMALDVAMATSGIRHKRVDDGTDATQRRYITWTDKARFPDTNQFQASTIKNGATVLIAYARAHVGYSDAGNNLKRLTMLTKKLAD